MERRERNEILVAMSKAGASYAEMGQRVSLSGARVKVILGDLSLNGEDILTPVLTNYRLRTPQPTLPEYPKEKVQVPVAINPVLLEAQRNDALYPITPHDPKDTDPNDPDALYFNSDEEADAYFAAQDKEAAEIIKALG